MQKNSIQTLSKLAIPLKSKGRFFKEKETHLRSDFQRDRDRIIHSTAFRRLKHKTQVFVNTSGDHFRTRITHSLEVAQIARTLSKFFNLNVLSLTLWLESLFESYTTVLVSTGPSLGSLYNINRYGLHGFVPLTVISFTLIM